MKFPEGQKPYAGVMNKLQKKSEAKCLITLGVATPFCSQDRKSLTINRIQPWQTKYNLPDSLSQAVSANGLSGKTVVPEARTYCIGPYG